MAHAKEYARAEFRLDTKKIPIYRAMIKNLYSYGYIERPTLNALAKKCLEWITDKFERNVLKSSNPASESLTTNKRAIIEDQQAVDQAGVRVEAQGQGEDSLLHDSLSFSFAEIGSLREELRKMHMGKLAQNNPSEFLSLIEYDRGKEEAFYV